MAHRIEQLQRLANHVVYVAALSQKVLGWIDWAGSTGLDRLGWIDVPSRITCKATPTVKSAAW